MTSYLPPARWARTSACRWRVCPYHSVEGYVAKLIQAGHKVAMVEQVGDVPARGLVDREVMRVVTPGTVVEPSLLDERRNNYLAAVVVRGPAGRAGLR